MEVRRGFRNRNGQQGRECSLSVTRRGQNRRGVGGGDVDVRVRRREGVF